MTKDRADSRTKERDSDYPAVGTDTFFDPYAEPDDGDPYERAAVRPRINGYWEDPLDCDELGRW